MSQEATNLPSDLAAVPLLPLRDVVVFPHMVIPLFVGRPKSIKALEAAMDAGRQIMLVAQRAAGKDEPKPDDMFEVGCVSSILQMLKLPDGTVKVLVEGVQRANTIHIGDNGEHFVAEVKPVPPETDPKAEIVLLEGRVDELFESVMVQHYDPCYRHSTKRSYGPQTATMDLALASLEPAGLEEAVRRLIEVDARQSTAVSVASQ